MLILVGASATGKTEIVKRLIDKYGLEKMVTYTTRPMRVNEIDGKDYHFISENEFLNKANNHEFVETVCYNGNYYGTLKKDVNNNKVVILEPSGLNNFYQEFSKDLVSVLIQTPKSVRHDRMIERCDNLEDIKKRLNNDDVVFNISNLKKVDLIIQNDGKDLDEITDNIYQFYIQTLNSNI